MELCLIVLISSLDGNKLLYWKLNSLPFSLLKETMISRAEQRSIVHLLLCCKPEPVYEHVCQVFRHIQGAVDCILSPRPLLNSPKDNRNIPDSSQV